MVRRGCVVLIGGLVAACYGATDVQVVLTSELRCEDSSRAVVFAGPGSASESAVSERSDCVSAPDGASLGSIVVIPRSDAERKGAVTVTAALTTAVAGEKSPDACLDDPTECIIVRRSLSFVEHQRRDVPLRFFRKCIGVRCGDAETCNADGVCVSAAE